MKEEEDNVPGVPDKLFFRIGEAAEIVGVEPHVLRYWETEFKMRTQRSASGQRMYRRKDVSRFLKVKRLLHDEGFTIAGARKALLDKPGEPGADSRPPGGAEPVEKGDLSVLRDVKARIETLRDRIADVREQFSKVMSPDP